MIRVSVGLFGRMTFDGAFKRLPPKQRAAVVAHEQGHIEGGHAWRRFLARFYMRRSALSDLMHRQEYEADAYAKAKGYGPALVCVLQAHPEHGSTTHPSTKARVAKLLM